MKTLRIIAIAVLLLSGAAGAALAAGMGTSAGHDLDALWAQAQKNHDTAQADAIILLDSRTTTVGDEGTVVTRVHQVVWIATSRGIRDYADLRVPWNSATSTLEVELLRTWMDGRWWPDPTEISETAVVQTLPYAVALADDYTTLRETMLLHDGVELPCIMETAYTIAVQGPPTAGADGLFVFPGRDPVVRAECVVRVPLGVGVRWEARNGAPEPVVTENGVKELAWTMQGAGALKLPVTAQPEAYEPAVVWTTWESWEALLREFHEAVEAAAVLDGALADSVAAAVRGLPAGQDRVDAVLAFANRSVRGVSTDFLPWWAAPRPATQTFATGYGHALDRAVLVSALLQPLKAGKDALVRPDIVPVRDEPLGTAGALPRLADLDGVLVALDQAGGRGWYDAASGESGPAAPWRTLLRPRLDGAAAPAPLAGMTGFGLDVSLDARDVAWEGVGVLWLTGWNQDDRSWLPEGDSFEKTCERLVTSVLPEASIAAVRPAELLPHGLKVRFEISMAAPGKPGDRTRRLVLGQPTDGLLSRLPAGVHAFEVRRDSPLPAFGGGVQEVTVRLRTPDGATVHATGNVAIRNDAGAFSAAVVRDGDWVEVTRRLELAPTTR
ncbi:MAG: DUF3857 domain-containing protein, partial [Candidatus Krumholzibacteriia bacterium]